MKKFIFAVAFILSFTGLSEAQTSRRIQSSDVTGALGYTPIQSIQGMTGVITCGTGLLCSSQVLSVSGVPIGNLSGLGTGIAASLATNIGFAGAPVLFNGAGGTPSSMTATNLTGTAAGLNIGGNAATATTATTASAVAVGNITGAGAGCITWLTTPSSSNMRGCLTDETGTGLLYFQGGDIGTPSAGVGTNLTGTAAGLTAGTFTAGSATNLTSGTLPAARTNGHMNGTATNDSGAAGEVGEYITANLPIATPISLTTATQANVISLSLTAGDWDVWGSVQYQPAAGTVVAYERAGTNTVSATLPSGDSGQIGAIAFGAGKTGGNNDWIAIPATRISVSGTTTVYIVAFASFTTSTLQVAGTISARRRR